MSGIDLSTRGRIGVDTGQGVALSLGGYAAAIGVIVAKLFNVPKRKILFKIPKTKTK